MGTCVLLVVLDISVYPIADQGDITLKWIEDKNAAEVRME